MARVKKIRIRNLLGIEELEIEPGKVTVIEGPNASGKTSVLETVKAIIGGGHDATLLRKGAEEGEGVLILGDEDENGTSGDLDDVEIRKRVTPERSTLDVRHPKLGKVSAGQTFVNRLHDALSVNPVRFLTADNRVEILLEALSSEVSSEALREALGDALEGEDVEPDDLIRGVEGLLATDAIDRVRSAVYSARTGVNRVVKETRTHADQLRKTLPPDSGDVEMIETQLAVAEDSVEALREEANAKARDVENEKEAARESVDVEEDEKLAAIYAKRDEKVAALQAKIDKVRNEAGERAQEVIRSTSEKREAIGDDAAEALQAIEDEYRPRIEETGQEISALRERLKAAESAARTREMIDENETKAERFAGKSDALSEAIGRLDALKDDVLGELPIEGAEIRDGEIYVDGVHFDRLNTADRVDFALRVGKIRSGELGLVCVDDLELLDSEHFEAMVEALKNDPEIETAIVTRVSDDAFAIRSEN